MEKEKTTLETWQASLLLIFGMEIILIAGIFIFGGKNFFNSDTTRIGIFLPLGILTFVSIFFNFIPEQKELSQAFKEQIQKKEQEFNEEFKFKETKQINPKELKNFLNRYKGLKEFRWFVYPSLWLYLSIFLSLITISINFSDINFKGLLISILIHISLLTTFFLVTSIVSWTIAHELKTNVEEEAKEILERYGY